MLHLVELEMRHNAPPSRETNRFDVLVKGGGRPVMTTRPGVHRRLGWGDGTANAEAAVEPRVHVMGVRQRVPVTG